MRPAVRYPWALVGRTPRTEGWKLHLSSVQSQAPDLLRSVVPYLRAENACFKLAQDERVLSLLNEGELGATQVGKFITVYPESDAAAARLAQRLVARTRGFVGPEIRTDLHLGAVVYARYGAFNPVVRRDRFGYLRSFIHEQDGSLVPDRYSVPFQAPARARNPFARHSRAGQPGPGEGARGLLGPGYRIVAAIKARPYGGTFLALDLRGQETASLKVLKHGRPHCLSDRHGRDVRDRLKAQGRLHGALCARLPIPAADPYFEVDGHGFLPIQHLDGESLERFVTRRLVHRTWSHLAPAGRLALLRAARKAVEAVQALHAAGYVHRDLSPSNVWIGPRSVAYLLDLELAHAIGDPTPAFDLGTAGFMSPQQFGRQAPEIGDDLYAIGCLLAFVMTGIDPLRVLFASDRHVAARLQRMAAGVPAALVETVAACLARDPERRPGLDAVQRALSEAIAHPSSRGARASGPAPPFSPSRRRAASSPWPDMLARGQASLLAEAERRSDGLWLSARLADGSGGGRGGYEVTRHAARGVAGIVFLLARLRRLGHGAAAARRAVPRAVAWLVDTEPPAAARLPGLHFGEAGVAVAIAEAIDSGYVGRTPATEAYLRRSLAGALDWPDITHGAAGQGLAALYCADRLGDATLAVHVHRCASFLVASQRKDGSWSMPDGVEGMSGQTLTGFAHGVAGMAFFLAEYAARFDRPEAGRALDAAVAWLMRRTPRRAGRGPLWWAYGTHTRERWHWWCHGSPGIALTFLRLYERTRDRRHAETARRALRVHAPEVRHPNLTQCHGMSGLGEIYLEAARVLGEREWATRARWIANDLATLAREQEDRSLCWIVEDPYQPTGDLMVGYGGVLHFLLRLHEGGGAFPLLLDAAGG